MKKRKVVVIVLICITVFCLLLFAAFLLLRNLTPAYTPPLVLIHRPFNHEKVYVGEGVIAHITAEDLDGLTSLALWVDDQLIDTRAFEPDEAVEKIVLDSHVVQYFANGLIDDVLDGFRHMIERGYRGKNMSPHVGSHG